VVRELFLAFLAQHDDAGWLRVVDRIESAGHPVDRAATRIWFHFFPLALQQLMRRPDAADLARRMTLDGRWRLEDQIDTSHAFLFGHRYWPHARNVVLEYANRPEPPGSLDLGSQVQEAAARAAAAAGVATPLLIGITAIAMRTLQQVGAEALAASPGVVAPDGGGKSMTADAVVTRRLRMTAPPWWAVWGSRRRQSLVTFDERDASAAFPIIHTQHLTTAAALDTRDYRAVDPRCSEGPLPVHCRSCSCGTCWVGVLAGSERLSPMDDRERAKLRECGVDADSQTPIRLACMTQAHGGVSIVIPPWNGLLGRVLRTAG
jgi:ferredoxin